jgi:hypothetical protein
VTQTEDFDPFERMRTMLAGLHRIGTADDAAAALAAARAELQQSATTIGGEPGGQPDLGFGLIGVDDRAGGPAVYWIAVTDGEREIAIRARAADNWRGDAEAAVECVRQIAQRIPHSSDRLATLAQRDPSLTIP